MIPSRFGGERDRPPRCAKSVAVPRGGARTNQLLPRARLLHQPERRGRSSASLSVGVDALGSAGIGGGVEVGAAATPSPLGDIGAGSRTVERRRGGSAGAGAGGTAAISAGGSSRGSASAAGGRSRGASVIGTCTTDV